jgi:hypothetical protein
MYLILVDMFVVVEIGGRADEVPLVDVTEVTGLVVVLIVVASIVVAFIIVVVFIVFGLVVVTLELLLGVVTRTHTSLDVFHVDVAEQLAVVYDKADPDSHCKPCENWHVSLHSDDRELFEQFMVASEP